MGDPRLILVFPNIPAATTFWSDFGWSPDGSMLAWVQNDVLEIHRGIGSGSPTVQVMPTSARSVNWSAAGDKIVVHGTPHNQSIGGVVVVDPVAGTAMLVKANGSTHNSSFSFSVPAWSPQGSHLVAVKRTEGHSAATAIVRLDANGSGEVTLNVLGNVVGGNDFLWDWKSDATAP
jgi:Tol biopolymer transport system component